MRSFSGHEAFVQSLTFSPDGSLLATGSGDGTIRLWEVGTGQERQTLATGQEWASAIVFSPDGTRLWGGSHDGEIRAWDVRTGEPCLSASWHRQGRITALACSPDGRRLAWSGYDGCATCDLEQRLPQPQTFRDPRGMTFILRLSPDGQTMATAGTGPDIHLRDLETRRIKTRLRHGDQEGCWCLAFSPDGGLLAAAVAGGVQVWDLTTHRLREQVKDHSDVVAGVAFSPDGLRLLSCSWDRTVRLRAFDPIAGVVGRLLGCYDWNLGRLFDVAVSPDGMLAAVGGSERDHVVVWDVE